MPTWIKVAVGAAGAVVVGGLAIYFALQAHLDVGTPSPPPAASDGRG